MQTAQLPYWRLSSFYIFYFASLGGLMPYWAAYLQSLGFDAITIGQLMAILAITRMVAPNLAGWLADHTGRRMVLVRWGCLLAVLSFGGVLVSQQLVWLAVVMGVFSFFWNASLPQFEATTLHYLGDNSHCYGLLRLWGSIGFIIAVVFIGQIIGHYSIASVPWLLWGILLGLFLVSLSINDSDHPHPHPSHNVRFSQVLRQPAVWVLFLTAFINQVAHTPYYAFYTLYLTAHQFPSTTISYLWAVAVVAEIALFVMMHRLSAVFSMGQLLRLGLLLGCLRWLLMGFFVDSFALIYLSQLLHAATFALYHGTAMRFLARFFHGRLQGRAQALYTSISFGAGSAVGTLASGYLWVVTPSGVFASASLLCFIGYLLAWRWLRTT
jgi:PPP family 3-phenylpropionic acid transporter